MASIAKIDSPVELRERIDRGDVVVNYGLQVVYRNQGNVDAHSDVRDDGHDGPLTGRSRSMPDQIPSSVPFGGLSFTPDVWFKLYYKALTIEAEGIASSGGSSTRARSRRTTLRS